VTDSSAPDQPRIVDVVVEPEVCMRFMNCLRIARKGFKLDRVTGKSSAPGWRDVDPDELWEAGRSCPSGAIRIITDRGYVVPRWQEASAWDTRKHPAAGRPHDKSKDPYRGM
jgi:ferredoxin